MTELETDYLVVGAGAAGMAFTDALLTHSDATVTVVDQRPAPGGHWLDAYPFVRLHQPSAFYGVDSVPLGQDAVDAVGTNAGFYELAGPEELRAYFDRVMHRHFLPTGRVRYFPCSDYVGDHRFVSRLSGATFEARVKKKLVDTTYAQGAIPETSPPPFAVGEAARCLTPRQVARLEAPPGRFVIVGGGKTALDVCVFLLEQGVAPRSIRWIRSREAWWLSRRYQQPRALLPDLLHGAALQIEAMAETHGIEELFDRLESEGLFLRLDPNVRPTMFRGAIISERELQLLRSVESVVRMGHVRRVERDEIVLEGGRMPTEAGAVYVHCAARGLAHPPLRPIFEPGRVTIQPLFFGFACHQFALLGAIEATLTDDAEKNRLCPPIGYWDDCADFARGFLAGMAFSASIASHPKVLAWSKTSRLNPLGAIAAHADDPRVISSRERVKRFGAAAAKNLARWAAER